MKIVIAPQAFKGSLTAGAAAQAIEKGVKRVFPDAETVLNPVADGGDGTLEALLGKSTDAAWGVLDDTVVIEMAKVCPMGNSPMRATTLGLGQLIKKGLDNGYRKFIIGLGGSGTNDGGSGMAEALGARFLNDRGRSLPPGGEALQYLSRIDMSHFDPRVKESSFVMACDVNNPLTGPMGASRVFAPQKGASPSEVEELEKGRNPLRPNCQAGYAD